MTSSIKISKLELVSDLTIDDRIVINQNNVNTNSIKFSNFVTAITNYPLLRFKNTVVFEGPISGPTGGTLQLNVEQLQNVNVTAPVVGQVLVWSGTAWENQVNASIQLGDLSVNTSTTPSGGGSLSYNSITGVFNFTPADTLDATDYYTAAEVDVALADKADAADVYTSLQVDAALAQNSVDDQAYTDSEVAAEAVLRADADSVINSALAAKADATSVYTKAEANAAFAPAGSSGIALTDLSVSTGAASGGGTLAYDNATGAFAYAPADTSALAPLASPTFTGTPSAPTAVAGTNTTQVASTEFVGTAVSNAALTASTARALLGIEEALDDAAAGVAGVASGALYYNTTDSNYQLKS